MKILLITMLIYGCGTDNEFDVEGETTHKVVVEHTIPICDDPVFITKEDKLACIQAVTSITIDGEVSDDLLDQLSPDQLDTLGEGVE